MIKAAIVSIPATDSPEALPLGAACVAAALGADAPLRGEVEAFVLDGRLGEAPADLASRIASSGAAWAGFSVYSWSRAASAEAARMLRSRSPAALLFAGGPEATADPAGLLEEGGFDFAVVGEGETATARALEAVLSARRNPSAGLAERLAAIPGLALPGRPFSRAPAEDPGRLVSPWLSGAIEARGRADLVWELARGCPYRCAYCYESKGERGLRYLPLARVRSELELFAASGARYVFVLDPTFNADRERCKALLRLMRDKGPGIRWKLELRAELLDEATVRRLGELDCVLQVGMQSGRAETLAAVGRGYDREAFERGLRMLDRSGMVFGLDLIYGLPGDALRDFESSLDRALSFGPNHLDVFPLAVLPGTDLFDRAAELGLEARAEPPYLVESTREMGPADLGRAAALAAACGRFYTAGRAVGWFRAALAPLRRRPSAFLRAYVEWLGSGAGEGGSGRGAAELPSQARIEAEQLGFLEPEYLAAGKEGLWPALRDLVKLHGAMSRAVAEGEPTELELEYDPDELLSEAPASLARFAALAHPRRARVRVEPDEAEGARIRKAGAGGRRSRPSRL